MLWEGFCMRKKLWTTALAVLAVSALAAGCSSSGKGSPSTGANGGSSTTGGSGSTASGGTLKIGVISDLTGAFSSGFITAEKGAKAYVDAVNADGGVNGTKLSYVMGDTASSAPGALAAAQKLIQTDKVFAVVANSAVFFGAEPYLLKQGVPVIGAAIDGPEWTKSANSNMFASTGVTDYSKVNSDAGLWLKAQGTTTCGSIGYGNATSGPAASGIQKSCVAAGLKPGYLNAQVPIGSTDVGAIAIGMKTAGVDGIDIPVVPNTAFALLATLKTLGVPLKAALISTGYGGDLLASSAAVTAGQGYAFASVGQPIEANTPATQKMKADLALAGVTNTPTFAEQESYIAFSAIAAGIKAAGSNPSRESFMKAMQGIHDFDANGLLSPGTVDFTNLSPDTACIFSAKLQGSKFVPVTPVCGKTVPGVKVG
jgi:branched-chain amino acid transport system substrate-binding protein